MPGRGVNHELDDLAAVLVVGFLTWRGWKRHRAIGKLLENLGTDPGMQYTVHKWAALFWVVNMPMVLAVYHFMPDVWDRMGLLYTLIVSLYANGATDFGAMSAALAAVLQQRPTEPDPAIAEALEILRELKGDRRSSFVAELTDQAAIEALAFGADLQI